MSKTIYLVIGPKQSGKTTLIEKLSDAINDQFQHMKSIHIDTKAFRQHITGTDNGGTCMHASEAAYDLALTTLETCTRFPSNVNFVFFETSGMDADFRSKIVDIAKKNNFVIELIALDVGESQIRRNCEKTNTDTYVSMRQHKKYRREVLASLNRRDYNATYTLKSVDDEEKMTSIVDNIQSDGYISIYASDEDRICVVGESFVIAVRRSSGGRCWRRWFL
jgi:type II secretory ATPase GspE/PulE/Tfp pilus assembly ATPase PilB-like protein